VRRSLRVATYHHHPGDDERCRHVHAEQREAHPGLKDEARSFVGAASSTNVQHGPRHAGVPEHLREGLLTVGALASTLASPLEKLKPSERAAFLKAMDFLEAELDVDHETL